MISSWKGPISITWSTVQMLHGLWQAWSCDHFPGELSLVVNHPLWVKCTFLTSNLSFPICNFIEFPLLLVMIFWLPEHTADSSLLSIPTPALFVHSCSAASHPAELGLPHPRCRIHHLLLLNSIQMVIAQLCDLQGHSRPIKKPSLPMDSIWKSKVSSDDSLRLDFNLPCRFTIFMQPGQ